VDVLHSPYIENYRGFFLLNTSEYMIDSVADPDPGLGAFLTPGSGIRDGRKSASGSGIRDEQPGSYFLELRNHFFAFFGVKIIIFFDENPGSGMETVRIRDPGWKKVGSWIRDKHPGSATLMIEKDYLI
jgi:hypothetical protein